jgi:hypothetical protein
MAVMPLLICELACRNLTVEANKFVAIYPKLPYLSTFSFRLFFNYNFKINLKLTSRYFSGACVIRRDRKWVRGRRL